MEDELYHWGVKEDHKYVAKVKMKNGKYRYFYDKKEYQSYLSNKNNIGSKKSKIIFDKLGLSLKKVKKKVDSFLNKMDKKYEKLRSKNVGFIIPFTERSAYKAIDWVKRKFDGEDDKESKNHKYVKKITLPNGKARYFYSEDEYIAYQKRQEYQKNEPYFMKNIPEIDPSKVMTADEDMSEINEQYNPYDLGHSMNCMSCTTAYELRRRGYDVEAVSDVDGEPMLAMTEWYKDPKISFYSPGMFDTGTDLNNVIKKCSPNNSRGNLMVTWEGGGAHSLAYEVTNRGDVVIRDCQINRVIDSTDLTMHIIDVGIVRTDNLELQEGVLERVVKN